MFSHVRSKGFESLTAVRLTHAASRSALTLTDGLLQQHDGETGWAGGSGRLRRLSTNGVDMDGLGEHSTGLCRREDAGAAPSEDFRQEGLHVCNNHGQSQATTEAYAPP
jgi:hypothetical protein